MVENVGYDKVADKLRANGTVLERDLGDRDTIQALEINPNVSRVSCRMGSELSCYV